MLLAGTVMLFVIVLSVLSFFPIVQNTFKSDTQANAMPAGSHIVESD